MPIPVTIFQSLYIVPGRMVLLFSKEDKKIDGNKKKYGPTLNRIRHPWHGLASALTLLVKDSICALFCELCVLLLLNYYFKYSKLADATRNLSKQLQSTTGNNVSIAMYFCNSVHSII